MAFSQVTLRSVFAHFQAQGDIGEIIPYGSGHINDTFRVSSNLAGTPVHYILQRINSAIFTRPISLMANIRRVTEHLRAKLSATGIADGSGRTLTIIPALDGKPD